MAGPGGGSSGGGGFSGGSFSGGGGGFGGGSFGGHNHGGDFGGHHHHHHGHHHHGHFFGIPFFGRRVYVGGGCGGGIVTLIFLAVFAFLWFNGSSEYNFSNAPVYSEATMQDYANSRYEEAFGDYDGYEDNILLVFLANETADGYYTIAWVGDNVKTEINEMFGEYTEYGRYMNQYINTNYYGYTLDNNLADVVRAMESSIIDAKLGSSFNSKAASAKGKTSGLINYTGFDVSKDVVNDAVSSFTESTGIPLVIVVDMAERVFGGGTAEIANGQQTTDNTLGQDANTTTVEFTGTQLAVGAAVVIGVIFAVIFVAVMLVKKALTGKEKKKEQENKNDMPWES